MMMLLQIKNTTPHEIHQRLVFYRALITLRNKIPHKIPVVSSSRFSLFRKIEGISADLVMEGLGLITLQAKVNHRYLAKVVIFLICHMLPYHSLLASHD